MGIRLMNGWDGKGRESFRAWRERKENIPSRRKSVNKAREMTNSLMCPADAKEYGKAISL